jgi:hypothetical protein
MKHFVKLPLLLIVISMFLSCSHNRLKTNEKDLVREIVSQEKENEVQKAQKAENNNQADTLNRPDGAFRLREDRSVDPAHPPVIIDIAGSLNNVKEIKLSDVAATVKYVRLDNMPDSVLHADLKVRYYLLDNYIVAIDLYGINLYSKEGRYLRTVVKNEYTGVTVKGGGVRFRTNYTIKGGSMNVQGIGDRLLYEYYNTNLGQKYVMEYDCSSENIPKNYKFDPENPNQISGLGRIAVDLNNGKPEPPKLKSSSGMFGGSLEALFYGRSLFVFDHNTYTMPLHTDNDMMAVLNNKGDTLSSFSMLEKLKNYTKSVQRGSDFGTQYEKNGNLFFRPEFNDTVFQVIPPNKLLPVYILKLGQYKASMMEGVDPDFKLTGKIIPGEWAETDKFIYMTFTKDDYDCPNTRKKNTVKIYHALYSKLNRQLSIIKGDPYDYSPEILVNDIDGGMPVWPTSYMTGKNGEILVSLKGKDLKDRIISNLFKQSFVRESKKNDLVKFAKSLAENDNILMIVK